MKQITADPLVETQECAHCSALVKIDGSERYDSNGHTVCVDDYRDGTAYVEPLDYALDRW